MRRICILAALSGALCFVSSSQASSGAALGAAASADEVDLEFENYTLDNGLQVILHRDPRAPTVAVNIWYHVGSGDEMPGKSGFAHLFEHMMFQGAKHIGEDVHFDVLREIGATGINGTTNSDRTNYYEIVPRHELETALWLESDRMGYLLDVLTDEKLDEQRAVVKNERRQRYENPPYGEARKFIAEALYPQGHPYHHLTIGIHEDLDAASLDDVTAFFQKWYGPDNASLVVAGDFDEAKTKEMIEEYFGSFPRTGTAHRNDVAMPVLEDDVVIRKEDDVPEQKVWVAWHAPKFFGEGDAELDLLASVVAGGKDSRLYKELVMERKVARNINVYQASAFHSSVFTMTATAGELVHAKRIKTTVGCEHQQLVGGLRMHGEARAVPFLVFHVRQVGHMPLHGPYPTLCGTDDRHRFAFDHRFQRHHDGRWRVADFRAPAPLFCLRTEGFSDVGNFTGNGFPAPPFIRQKIFNISEFCT